MKTIIILFLIIGLAWSVKPDQKAEEYIQQLYDEAHQIFENKENQIENMSKWLRKWCTADVVIESQDIIWNGLEDYDQAYPAWLKLNDKWRLKVIEAIAVETQTWDYHAFAVISGYIPNGCLYVVKAHISLKLDNNKVSKIRSDFRMDDLIEQCSLDGYDVSFLKGLTKETLNNKIEL